MHNFNHCVYFWRACLVNRITICLHRNFRQGYWLQDLVTNLWYWRRKCMCVCDSYGYITCRCYCTCPQSKWETNTSHETVFYLGIKLKRTNSRPVVLTAVHVVTFFLEHQGRFYRCCVHSNHVVVTKGTTRRIRGWALLYLACKSLVQYH